MAKFFVGQRVRVIRSVSGQTGKTGRITHRGVWNRGDRLPCGNKLADTILGWCNCFLLLDDGEKRPAHSDNLEPILPEGHKAGDFSYEELLEHLETLSHENA